MTSIVLTANGEKRKLIDLAAVGQYVRNSPHWLFSALLACSVIPAFRATHLPLHANWQRLISAYWLGLGARALAAAVLLLLIGLPLGQTLKPMWNRYRAQKFRFLGLAVFAGWMIWFFGVSSGIILTVDGLALAELVDRTEGMLDRISAVLRSVLLPALYFFLGLILVFAYNDVIAAAKPLGSFDWLYLKLDSYIVPGISVSQLAHLSAARLPARALSLLELIYYGMFSQIGAAIILLAICSGSRQTLRLVGTMLTAYYLALALFYFWPSMGPFYTCSKHFATFPHTLETYGIQQSMLFKDWLISTHRNLSQVDTDYFIAFPCLHIAQPFIVLWFLRKWRRMAICLLAYDILLIPAILLLEWHYFVDLIGGVLVAVAAIAINTAPQARERLWRKKCTDRQQPRLWVSEPDIPQVRTGHL